MDEEELIKADNDIRVKSTSINEHNLKIFSKIRGLTSSPPLLGDDNKPTQATIQRTINRMVIAPCHRVSQAQSTLNDLLQQSRDFKKYLKSMKEKGLRERRGLREEQAEVKVVTRGRYGGHRGQIE